MPTTASQFKAVKSIILVEDNSLMRDLYCRELSNRFEVIAFSDYEGVIEALQSQPIVAVVLESELPSKKGWQLLAEIKQSFNTPVVLFNAIDSRKKAMEARADVYLLKPVTPSLLIETLLQISEMNPDQNSGIAQRR